MLQGLAGQAFGIAEFNELDRPIGGGHLGGELEHHGRDHRQHGHREQRADDVEEPFLEQVLGLVEDQRQTVECKFPALSVNRL